jgi:hypothetical protein
VRRASVSYVKRSEIVRVPIERAAWLSGLNVQSMLNQGGGLTVHTLQTGFDNYLLLMPPGLRSPGPLWSK